MEKNTSCVFQFIRINLSVNPIQSKQDQPNTKSYLILQHIKIAIIP